MNQNDLFITESYQIYHALENHDPTSALKHLQEIETRCPEMAETYWESRFLFGLAFYEAGDFDEAGQRFIRSLEVQPYDDVTQFYLGNCFLRARKFKEAKLCFKNAVKVRQIFPEARKNLAITTQSIMQGHVKKSDWDRIEWHVSPDLNIDVEDSEACLDIPIFINNRDRVECLEKLLDWLLDAGYRRIYILDQDSTYPPLLEFYETFRKNSRVHVLRMGKNYGFQCIWQSGILEDLDIQTPYVYTDSDILPTCGKNIVQELLRSLKKYPLIKKVGAKLIFEDITFQRAEACKKHNAGLYSNIRLISRNEIFTPVDTTFSVYRNFRRYCCLHAISRTDIEIRHLPWYYDLNNLPPDEKYYIEHANSSSTFAEDVKNRNSDGAPY